MLLGISCEKTFANVNSVCTKRTLSEGLKKLFQERHQIPVQINTSAQLSDQDNYEYQSSYFFHPSLKERNYGVDLTYYRLLRVSIHF